MGNRAISGAKILLECLKRLGVTDIFGYPGGSVIPIYDELYLFDGIKHFLARHEQGAAHEADGYARATGKVGVCLATSGPGATNLVTGIMTAFMDSIPLLAITGQVGRPMLGRDSFQETDITSITLPITKTNYLVKNIQDLPRIIKEAYYIAKTGRPGPVLIDIPRDIQLETIALETFEKLYSEELSLEGYNTVYSEDFTNIDKVISTIKNSKKPLIISGAGIIHAKAKTEFELFVKKLNIPVTSTLLGLGGISGEYELFLGMLGMHGTAPANLATYETDLIIGMGFRFDDRITGNIKKFAPNAKIIHMDIDPAEIEKNIKVDLPVIGDLKKILNLLNEKINNITPKIEWINRIKKLKSEYELVIPRSNKYIYPQYLLKKLNSILKGDAIIATDVGQHQMWTALHMKFKNSNSIISSGGAGTMGFGLPSAIGAQIGVPSKKVVAIVGDGGIQMNIQELILLKQYNLPIKIIILNNSYLGMVRQWQQLFHENRYSSVNLDFSPDFVKLAEAYGIKAFTLSTEKELENLENILNLDEPVLINCIVKGEENVFPMIPAGGSVEDMIGLKGVNDYD